MTDLRVNTRAIQDSYLDPHDPLTRHPIWAKRSSLGSRTMTYASMDEGTARVVNLVRRFVEARLMGEHRQLVEFLDHDLLWDGPPIRLSNKGHLRVAKYLSTFFARAELHPTVITVTPVGADRHLVEFDAVLVNHPTRVWWIPATLLLPRSISYSVHFKVGVHGPLEAGKIQLVIGRVTNLPAMFPQLVRQYLGMVFGAIPHAFEGAWGYLVDFTGDDYYRAKREARFLERHPNSQSPMVDRATDMAQDILGWAKDNAWTAFDTAYYLSEGLINTARDYGSWAFTTAINLVEGGVQTASATAGKVAGSAAGAADVVVDYGKAAVGTGARVAGDVAGAAYDTAAAAANKTYATAAGVAGSAYDATVTTADKTYNAAAGAADNAYERGYATAATAADTVTDSANRTYEATTGVANRAYEKAMGAAQAAAGAVKDTAATAESKAAQEKRKGAAAAAAPAGYDSRVTYTAPVVRSK